MLLWYIYIALISLNVIAALVRWGSLSTPMRVLSGLLLWGVVIEILRWEADRNTAGLLTHLNILVELLLQFVYYYLLLKKGKRPFLLGGLILFCIALLVTWMANPGFFTERNYLDGVFLGVCMTLWCGLFFQELIQQPLQYSLKTDGNFWINCGNILFYPGTLMLFGLGSYIEHINPELRQSLKPINNTLNLVLYALYLAAFCLDRKQIAPSRRALFIDA